VGIDRLTVEEGRAILIDATSGMRVVVDKLRSRGRCARSPGRIAARVVHHRRRPLSLSHQHWRVADDGMKFKLGLDYRMAETIEADRYGRARSWPPKSREFHLTRRWPLGTDWQGGSLSEPWNANRKVTVSSAAALFEQIEFNYGPENGCSSSAVRPN